MINPQLIWDYYASDKFDPYLPDKPSLYHFRVIDDQRITRKIPVRITSKEKLRKWLLRLNATDVYFSTAQWLNPEKIGRKGESGSYRWAHNLLLDHSLYFDTDAKPVCWENLEQTYSDIKQVYAKCIKDGFRLNYLAFSGSKGFIASFTDNVKIENELPVQRIDNTSEKRKVYIVDKFEEIDIDQPVTTNVMGIRRLPGTIHSKTGFVCSLISPENLHCNIKTIINNCPYVTKRLPGIPTLGEMTKNHTVNLTESAAQSGVRGRFKDKFRDIIFKERCMTNNVLGARNLFVPLFEYNYIPTDIYFIRDLKRLQSKYNIGPLYLYRHYSKYHDTIYALGIKTFQKPRLEKIYRQSMSNNISSFKRFARGFMTFPLSGSEPKESFNFIGLLYQKPKGNISKGHLLFNSKFCKDKQESCNIIGSDKLKTMEVSKKWRG